MKMRFNVTIFQVGLASALSLGLAGCAGPQQSSRGQTSSPEVAAPAGLALGREALSRMGGCYIVDYNFHETRPLAAGYSRDERVYDINEKKTVMEWVYPVESGQ